MVPNCPNQNFFKKTAVLGHNIFGRSFFSSDVWAKQIGVKETSATVTPKNDQGETAGIWFANPIHPWFYDGNLSINVLTGRWSRRSNVKKVLACAILVFQMFGEVMHVFWMCDLHNYREHFFMCCPILFSSHGLWSIFFSFRVVFVKNPEWKIWWESTLPSLKLT